MPYFVFKVFPNKEVTLLEQFAAFKAARQYARELRAGLSATDDFIIKVIFARNALEAEVLLKEERERRPLGDD